jgi:hypothetical protein
MYHIMFILRITGLGCDIVERDKLLHMKQGGYYHCSYCYQRGIPYGGQVCFPKLKCPLRTNIGWMFDSLVAEKFGASFRGVSGRSPLAELHHFHIPDMIPVDPTHVCDLGIALYFLELWTGGGPSFVPPAYQRRGKLKPWRLSPQDIEAIDSELANSSLVRLPHTITRRPLSIGSASSWKADTLRTFTQYLSLPLLKSRLPDPYWQHWKMFVTAYIILNKNKIHRVEIDYAEELLREFVKLIPSLYLPNFTTIKVHSLLHLPHSVRLYGPLQHFSTIRFEDLNGQLIRKNQGHYKVSEHLFQNFTRDSFLESLLCTIPDAESRQLTPSHPLSEWINRMIGSSSKRGWSEMGHHNGSYKNTKCSTFSALPHRIAAFLKSRKIRYLPQRIYHTIIWKGVKYHSWRKYRFLNDSSAILFHGTSARYVGYLRGFVKDDHNTWRALVEHSTFPYKGFCQALPSKSITQLELITLRQLIDVCVQADRGTHIWFTPIHAQSFSFPLGTPRNASYYSAPNPILDNASLLNPKYWSSTCK